MTAEENIREIAALIRVGAVTRAWGAFVDAGLEQSTSDPAVLTLKGRLLKDQARKAHGEVAARIYLQSAKAYADAAALRPDSYPLINAATMSLFAGQPDHMALLAQHVLNMLDTGAGVGETAYWHEATRAEALLLLERQAEAQAALDKAIVAAPAAYEDRAVTLKQFRLITEFRGCSSDWLAYYAPPASLYFTGMIGIAPDDRHAADLAREAVNNSKAGFGYGALAAGADILIGEALIESGKELHLILPIMSSAFRAQSVAPYGEAWLPRFDRLFEQAASVAIVSAGETLTDAAIIFAAQVAKGAAVENAGRLESHATGLELNDGSAPDLGLAADLFVALKRSASLPPTSLAKGDMLVTVVTDQAASDGDSWTPIADGFYARNVESIASVTALLITLKTLSPDARSAVRVAAVDTGVDTKDVHVANLLRMAQCATAGTVITDSYSAHAILSVSPQLRTEPLGELPDAGRAIAIYAIEPRA